MSGQDHGHAAQAAAEAFLAVMRARRPDLLWSIEQQSDADAVVPDDPDTLGDRRPLAA